MGASTDESWVAGLWMVWTTRKRTRSAHTSHSPYGDGGSVFGDQMGQVPDTAGWVPFQSSSGYFFNCKWVLFQLSECSPNCPSGYFFDRQMGTFSLDKNRKRYLRANITTTVGRPYGGRAVEGLAPRRVFHGGSALLSHCLTVLACPLGRLGWVVTLGRGAWRLERMGKTTNWIVLAETNH